MVDELQLLLGARICQMVRGRACGCVVYSECGHCIIFVFFFFSSRRRHTRSDRDWSSDVCSSDLIQLSAQAARGFRLGGINDPINVPLCSPADLTVFGNQKTWKDEKTWNYELGLKSQSSDHRVTFNVSAFYSDIKDLQATTTAGTCSSRIVFNVPTSRSEGIEAELFARPNSTWDFGISATVVDAKLTSSVTSTLPGIVPTVVVVGGLADGNRLPTAPKTQAAASVGYTLPVQGGRDFFASFTVQYIGSSFSQFENQKPGFGH